MAWVTLAAFLFAFMFMLPKLASAAVPPVQVAMDPVAIVGQHCNIRGFRLAATGQLVPISYSGLAFAALLGLVFFDEWPRPAAIAGAVMICAGAIYLARDKPVPAVPIAGPAN